MAATPGAVLKGLCCGLNTVVPFSFLLPYAGFAAHQHQSVILKLYDKSSGGLIHQRLTG